MSDQEMNGGNLPRSTEGAAPTADLGADADIQELANVDSGEHERQRQKEALDEGVAAAPAAESSDAQGKPGSSSKLFPTVLPWPEPVSGVEVLDEIVMVLRRHLALPDFAAEAIGLWIVFTHLIYHCDISPRLALQSPTPRCGKTTAIGILSMLVRKPLPASNWSPAVVFRVVDRDQPTLLIDEADTFLDIRSEMFGILNSGHSRAAAYVMRADGRSSSPSGFQHGLP